MYKWEKPCTPRWVGIYIYIFLRVYLFERAARESTSGGKGEASSLLSRKPDVRLHPRTLGS